MSFSPRPPMPRLGEEVFGPGQQAAFELSNLALAGTLPGAAVAVLPVARPGRRITAAPVIDRGRIMHRGHTDLHAVG